MIKNALCILYVATLIIDIVSSQSLYRAAVIEYAPKTSAETVFNRVLENVKEYVNYIAEAADEAVDIIIFPEYGLTGMDIGEKNIYDLSMEVPDPKLQVSPCQALNSNYSKALIDLSCAAQAHRIYVVLNLVERYNDTGSIIYYNTNIVLNRDGVVTSRFRKMNLYEEAHVKPGNETATFKTDFGVTFGMFICNDIMYKNPSLDILADSSVADIIYSTAWFSTLPFAEALSMQHGYAVSNGVNLLVSGLNNPTNGNGGSGVFLSTGDIVETYKSGAKSSKMVIANIPKIDKRNQLEQCRLARYKPIDFVITDDVDDKPRFSWGTLPDISSFHTFQTNMANFTFKSIIFNQTNITEEVCAGIDRQFCCSINITANISNTPKYSYKLVVFNGGTQLGWETIGVRTCGLIACLNNSEASCGLRYPEDPKDSIFKSVFLKASFPNANNTHDQPSTLSHDLTPMNNYTFCKQSVNEKIVELTLSTLNPNPFLTFGFFGRVFDNDNRGVGFFSSAAIYVINPYLMFTISIFIFLLQD